MSPFTFYFKPKVLSTLTEVLQTKSPASENHDYLDNWLLQKYPDHREHRCLRTLLEKLDAIEFGQYCGDWFRELALGYDVYEEIGTNENGEPVRENFIKLTELGKQFIDTLFVNYLKPIL